MEKENNFISEQGSAAIENGTCASSLPESRVFCLKIVMLEVTFL